MTIETKQQIIEHILSKYFDNDSLDHVMQDWASNYSDKPSSSIHKLISEHCANRQPPVKPHGIIKEVLIELNRPQAKTIPATKTPLPATTPTEPNTLQSVFYAFYDHLYQSCPLEFQQDILSSFLDSLSKLSAHQKKLLNVYLEDKTTEMLALEEKEMQKLISTFYQAMCLWMGPVDADTLFSQSINQLRESGKGDWVDKLI